MSTAGANSEEGQAVGASWSVGLAADVESFSAGSASTVVGNAVSTGQSYGLGVLQGKSYTLPVVKLAIATFAFGMPCGLPMPRC